MLYAFGDLELDTAVPELRRDGAAVPVEPQVLALLTHLVRHRDRIVPREELLDAVWGHRFVVDATLGSRVKAARRAIGDSGAEQRLIRTFRGRGLRFVGEVTERAPAVPEPVPGDDAGLVGRAAPLRELRRHLTDALAERRRVVFVGGERGAGKSALLTAFLDEAARVPGLRAACGRCVEWRGPAEPYQPVLDLLGRLAEGPAGERVVAALRTRAPTWLAQLPWLDGADPPPGVTAGRMLREAIEALEALAADGPLVVALEDLHWADASTLDLLGALARRDGPARLLVVATHRSDVGAPVRALAADLALRDTAAGLALGPLDVAAVGALARARRRDVDAAELHRRSGGNPLFVVSLLDAGDDPTTLPPTLAELVEAQLRDLDPADQRLLEAGAVAGASFSAAELGDAAAEERCAALARERRLLRPTGSRNGRTARSPSDTPSPTTSIARCSTSASRPAAAARCTARSASASRRCTATTPARRPRPSPATSSPGARRGVPCRTCSPPPARRSAAARTATRSSACRSPRASPPATRRGSSRRRRRSPRRSPPPAAGTPPRRSPPTGARPSCRASSTGPPSCPASSTGWRRSKSTGRTIRPRRRSSSSASRSTAPTRTARSSRELLSCSRFLQGAFVDALEHADLGLSAGGRSAAASALGEDLEASSHGWAALAHWFLGRPDEALRRADLAVEVARRPGRSYGLAGALAQRARLRQHRDEPEAAREDAVACAAVAERGGFPYFQAVGTMVRGWAAGALGDPGAGLEDLRAGLAAHAATGAAMDRPYFLALLAETLDRAGRRDEAVATIDEALAALPDGRPFYYEAELWRLRGELADDAEAARRAVAVARRQGAVALERRAAATLAARNLHTGST